MPAGTRWDAPTNFVVPEQGLVVQFGRRVDAKQLELSFDNNDEYEIRFRLGGSEVARQSVGHQSGAPQAGLAVAVLVVPEPAARAGYDEILIVPVGGDGRYSVGHLRLLDAAAPDAGSPPGALPLDGAPVLGEDDLPVFARLVAETLAGTRSTPPPELARRLGRPTSGLYVALRQGGTKRGSAWARPGPPIEALPAALRRASRKLEGEQRAAIDTVELCLVHSLREIDPGSSPADLANEQRGGLGLELGRGKDVVRHSPTEMIARNLSFKRARERFERGGRSEHGDGSQAPTAARVFGCEQVLVELGPQPRAIRLFRGNQLVGVEQVRPESVRVLGELLAAWLVGNVHEDGRMTYKYWPSREQESAANNAIRQWMATGALAQLARERATPELLDIAERNARYNLAQFYRRKGPLGLIEHRGEVKLGALALAALALAGQPERARFADAERALARSVEQLWQPDGSFVTSLLPAGLRDNQNFYPGEALLLWSVLYAETKSPALLDRCRTSFRYYRSWHRQQRNPAFVPWHTRACYNLWRISADPELRDFIFEMNDWLLGVQQWDSAPYPDMQGQFFRPDRPDFGPPHVSSTGVYLEGLVDAWLLASELGDEPRREAYRRAIVRGLRSVMQQQFADGVDMFYVTKRERVRGGVRTTVWDNTIRVDNVQHNLLAVLKILHAFAPEDYRP